MKIGLNLIIDILESVTAGLKTLTGTSSSSVPLYRNKMAIASASSVVLEGVGTALGFPGVGSAVGIILSAVLGRHDASGKEPTEKLENTTPKP